MLVPKRHKDNTLMHERAQTRNNRALLATTLSGCGNKNARIFSVISTRGPLLARLVPKRLPLRGEVAVTGCGEIRSVEV